MQVIFGVSVDDIVAHALYQAEHSNAVRRAWATQEWILGALLAFLIVLGGITGNIGLVAFSLAMLGAALVVIPRSHRWTLARMTRAVLEEGDNRRVLGTHTLEITPEAVVDTTQYGSCKVLWAAVDDIETTEEYAFVHTGMGGGYAVPKRAFLDNMDFEEFAGSVDDDGVFRGFPR